MSTLSWGETKLTGGLPVVTVVTPHLHRAHVGLYVRTGSRFEREDENGISHFLEHMLYRGTPTLKNAHAVNLAFEELGGYLHASTQADYGIFSVTLPPESLEKATLLFGDVLSRPAFFDIDVERGIVSEEILEDLDDEGRQINADNLSRALIYPDHPLGFTLTGSPERVLRFTEEDLRRCHARHYTQSTSVLVLAGPIDPSQAIEVARTAFSGLSTGEPIAAVPPASPLRGPLLRVVKNLSSQTELRVCLRAFSENAPERIPLEVLMRTLDDGMSTRLYHRICDDRGLCYNVSAGYDGYEDDGVLDLSASVQHARAPELVSEMLRTIEELGEHGPTEEEVEKAKRRLLWDMTSMLDSVEELAHAFGVSRLFGRDPSLDSRRQAVKKITRDDVVRVAKALLDPGRLHVVAVGLPNGDRGHKLRDAVKGWRA